VSEYSGDEQWAMQQAHRGTPVGCIPVSQVARALGLPADATVEQVLSTAGLLADLRGQVISADRAEVTEASWRYSPELGRHEGVVVLQDLDSRGVQRLGGYLGAEVRILVTTAAVQGAAEVSRG